MDNFVIAMSRYRRRKYDDAIKFCDQILQANHLDQSAWILKCKSLTMKNHIDDIELDEEGVGDMLLDENQVNTLARPGTSIYRPATSSGQGVRPMTNQGRLQTGFARPQTNRPGTQDLNSVLKTARQGPRVGTSRPVTQGGRYVRLGTASVQGKDGQFMNVNNMDFKKIAKKPVVSRAVCDYLIYVEHNPKKALDLCAEATVLSNYNDWWWKERLGKCYYMLGLLRDAEKQFKSSLTNQEMIQTSLQLAKVQLKLDQPQAALQIYKAALEKCPQEISFMIALARLHDLINEPNKAVDQYRQILAYESSNLETVASLAAYHFYIDQPEVSIRFYKRLVQLGVSNSEIWNNLGLCCFYDGQYDLFYSCFERALSIADDSNKADIWYNLSHVFINLGDLGTAYQCLKLTIFFDQQHSEAYNNLAIIDSKKGDFDRAKINYQSAIRFGSHNYEPAYNYALLCYKNHEYSNAYKAILKALQIYPEHAESIEIKQQIEKILQNI